MDNIQKRLQIAEWIAAHYAGTITPEEEERLKQWLEESPSHMKEMERILDEIRQGAPEIPDMKKMWEEFEHRISHSHKFFRQWVRYAAILFIPLACLLYFYLHSFQQQPLELATETVITPGKTKAQLLLADGRQVELDKDVEMEIKEKGGTAISVFNQRLEYRNRVDSLGQMVYNTLIVPKGGEYTLMLADSTQVWLNAGSRLKFPVTFTGNVREVEMEGEGFFEVKKNEYKPFVVKVKEGSVTVLGTSFNISTYDGSWVTTLVNGKVCMTRDERKITLFPDQQAVFDPDLGDFLVKQVVARNYTLWKEGYFWFEDTDLETLMNRLADWYGAEVFYTDPELKKLRFSVEMKRYEDIGTVLRKIEYTGKVRFGIRGQAIVVSK